MTPIGTKKFTQSNVNKLRQTPGKTDETFWDPEMPGFGIRFRNGGAGVYIIQYSLHGRQGKIALGKVSQVALADAQNEARQQFAMIARKVDPVAERAKILALTANTFKSQIEPFIADLEKAGRSEHYVDNNRRSFRYFSALHGRGIKEIDRAMVAKELSDIARDHGERAAGNCRSHLHKFFSWAIEEGFADLNPVSGTKKRASVRRSRVLTPEELVHIWNASGEGDYGTIVKLLILTAARADQIGSLRRDEIKLLENADPALDRLIDLPAGRNKNKERFLLPLSKRAQALLSAHLKRAGSPFVFGTTGTGFSGWSMSKVRLEHRLEGKVEDWTHHDFRRTFDSLGIDKCKIEPWVTDVCLHHVGEHKKGVKRTYNHAHYLDKKRAALETWADYVDSLLAPKLAIAA